MRGFAAPPCSTPVSTPQKKSPKKLCAFWGFISVPVVGGSRGLLKSPLEFCARLCRAALFDPRAHASKEKPEKALRPLGFYISAGGGRSPRASKVSTGDFCARLCRAALFDPRAHASKEKPQKALRLLGFYISAGGGGRTHTVSPPTDFESAQVRRTWWIFRNFKELISCPFLVKKHLSTIQFLIFGRTYDWKSGRPT